MVGRLRARLLETGHQNAHAEVGDAARLALPDPLAAVREWRRVLRPGGRLGLSTWAAVDIPVMTRLEQELGRLGVPPRPRGEAFSSPDSLRQLFVAGGFPGSAMVTRPTLDVRLAGTDELLAWMWSHGGRSRLEHLDADALRRLSAALAGWDTAEITMRWTALLADVVA